MFQYLGCTSSTSYWRWCLASNYRGNYNYRTRTCSDERSSLPSLPVVTPAIRNLSKILTCTNTETYEISLSLRSLDISQPDTWCENTTNDISVGNCLSLKLMDHQMNDFNKISNHWVSNYSSCSNSPERDHTAHTALTVWTSEYRTECREYGHWAMSAMI